MGSVPFNIFSSIISWRKCDLKAIDRKTRKLFSIYGALYPYSDVDRFYIPRNDGRRGFIAIEDCLELAVTYLEFYVHGSEEKLLQAARGDREDSLEAASVLKEREETGRLGGENFTWLVFETN